MSTFHTTRPTQALSALALAATLALGASACGSDASSSSSGAATSSSAAQSSTEHNDADVSFASDMLPHHAQALMMVEMTADRPLDPEVQQLADDIRAAQAPEIDTMTGWLTDWDETVPDTSGSMEAMDSPMAGMMSGDEMTALGDASDAEFQTRWLELMVKHHEGAVEMARTEISEGRYLPAVDLANSIVASQSKEISTMKAILG